MQLGRKLMERTSAVQAAMALLANVCANGRLLDPPATMPNFRSRECERFADQRLS